MPIEEYHCSPVVSAGNSGSLGVVQEKVGTAVNHITSAFVLGANSDKSTIYNLVQFRYEISGIPADAIILGVRHDYTSTGAGVSPGARQLIGGFLKRDGLWDALGGMDNYDFDTQVPMGEYAGNTPDLGVFWGDAPAFDGDPVVTMFDPIPVNGTHESIGDGTLAAGSTYSVTGMVAQLQSYWADAGNQALRDERHVPDGVPVSWSMYRMWVGAENKNVQIYSSMVSPVLIVFRPRLFVEWTPPGSVEAESDAVAYARGRGGVGPAVEAESSVSRLARAYPDVGPLVVGIPDVIEEAS